MLLTTHNSTPDDANISSMSCIASAVLTVLDRSIDDQLPSEQAMVEIVDDEIDYYYGTSGKGNKAFNEYVTLILTVLSLEGVIEKFQYHNRCHISVGRGEWGLFTLRYQNMAYQNVSKQETLLLLLDLIICLEVLNTRKDRVFTFSLIKETLSSCDEVIPLNPDSFGGIDPDTLIAWGINVLCKLNLVYTRPDGIVPNLAAFL